MRIPIAAIVFLAASTAMAAAADLRRRPPPYEPMPVRAVYDWTGFYFGGNVGGGWANTKSDFSVAGTPAFASVNNSIAGVLGGLQTGYNWQTGPMVFGFETDFQFTGLEGRINSPTCPAAVCGVATAASFGHKLPWFGTVRGRLGYAADSWMMYATGGYAYGRIETDATATAGPISASLSRSETRSGWTVGGGIEVALSRNWTAKAEYLYVDLGSSDQNLAFAGLPAINDRSRVYLNVARTGLNYRF
jgi:outer membrane immunogenic protein